MSLVTAYSSKRYKELALISILFSSTAFLALGFLADDLIAQDRNRYYLLYLKARAITGTSDFIFTAFLGVLPRGLDETGVFLILLIVLLCTMLNAFRLIRKKFTVSHETLALVFFFVVADRIFIDLSLNTMRSSIALLIAISGLISFNSTLPRIVTLAFAFGFHQLAIITFIVFYGIYLLFMKNPRSIRSLAIVGLLCFALRVLSFQLGIGDYVNSLASNYSFETERAIRSVQVSQLQYSISLTIQFLLGIALPLSAYLLQTRRKTYNLFNANYRASADQGDSFLNIGAFFGGVVLIFYPEITTSLRFSLIPILFLGFIIPKNILRVILPIKLFSLTYGLN
jgi:hypothetical protein